MSDRTVSLCLRGLLHVELSYTDWETKFVRHWGASPVFPEAGEPGHHAVVTAYLKERGLQRSSHMSFTEAARAFHVGPLRFRSKDQFVRFVKDYDLVEPELAEAQLDDIDHIRLEQQARRFGDTEDLGRRTFDMGRGTRVPIPDRALPRLPWEAERLKAEEVKKGKASEPKAGSEYDVERGEES